MKPLPFKVRITLLSVAISGVVLAGFGVWALLLTERVELRRLDEDLGGFVGGHLDMRLPPEHWQNVGRFVLGGDNNNQWILFVKGRNNEVLYKSQNWPPELSEDQFPAPQTKGDDASGPDALRHFGPGPGRPDFEQAAPPGGPPPDFGPPPPQGGSPPGIGFMRRGPGPLPFGGPGRPPGAPGFGPPMGLPRPPVDFRTEVADGTPWRIGIFGNGHVTVAFGQNLTGFVAHTRRTRIAFLFAYLAALGIVGAGGWLLSERALRPVKMLAATAESITAQGLNQRMPAMRNDVEFDRLSAVLNAMLDRLERSFKQAVRFSADASHELKTPLTVLQGELEQAVQEAPPGSETQETLSRLLGEVQRLKAITRKLLLLSLADAGRLTINAEPVNLSEAVESVCDDCQILAPNLNVGKDIQADLWVHADPDLVNQVLQNLANNAIKYNEANGWVRFVVVNEDGLVRLTIVNSGPGIRAEDRDKVFDRFFRGDKSRDRRVDGTGLGLSLAREIVRAHGGELALGSDSNASSTTFVMTLPATNAQTATTKMRDLS